MNWEPAGSISGTAWDRKKTSDEEIRELLGIPAGRTVLNLAALGEKGEAKRAYKEEDLHFENVHFVE